MIPILLGRALQFVLMFVSVKWMTTLLSPEEVGRFTLINTTTAFFALFLINPIGMFFNRKLHAWFERGVARHYFHYYLGYMVLVALFSAGCVWVAGVLGIGQADFVPVAVLVACVMLFGTLHQTLVPTLNMLGQIRGFLALTVLTLFIGLLFSGGLAQLFYPSAVMWLAGSIAAQTLFALLAYRILFPEGDTGETKPKLDAAHVRTLWRFGWPVAVAVGFNWVHMQGYRFYLANNHGLSEFGMFAAGYGVAAAVLAAFELVLTTRFQPFFYQRINAAEPEARHRAWGAYAKIMLPASFLGVTGVVATADELAVLFLGPAFHGVGDYVQLGALAEWMRIVVGVFVLHAHAEMKTHTLIVPNLIGAVMACGLTVWAVPWGGLGMAPIAVAIGAGACAVCLMLQSPGLWSEVIPLRRHLGCALCVSLCLLAVFRLCAGEVFNPWRLYGVLGSAGVLWSSVAFGLWWFNQKDERRRRA